MGSATVATGEGDGEGVADEATGAGLVAGATDALSGVAGSDGVSGPATTSPRAATAATDTAARARCRGVGAAMSTDHRRSRLYGPWQNPRPRTGIMEA